MTTQTQLLEKGKGHISSVSWLKEFLSHGPRTLNEVRDAARTARWSWETIKQAKLTLDAYSPYPGLWKLREEEEECLFRR